MKVKVLASGSKGNCTYLECGKIKILIDLGIGYLTVKRYLEEIKVDPKEINGILITHIHNDHIKGLASFVKRTNTKVFVPAGIAIDLKAYVPKDNIFLLEEKNDLFGIELEVFHTSHDVPCSVGYIINYENHSLVYVTDTGYINQRILKKLQNKTIYIMESNHDEKMLMDGPYPYILKQRVISDSGHLSNKTAASYLKQLIGQETQYIVLAHLSETNNTEQIAYQTLLDAIPNPKEKIYIAKQSESIETIEV